MVMMAVWLQSAEISESYVKWVMVFVGLLALAMLIQAITVAIIGMKSLAILTDLKKSFDETKGKAIPLLAKVEGITHTTQGILTDIAPKIKVISENIAETTHTVRGTARTLDVTIRQTAARASATFEDANARTAKQVARVDGMVTSTLAATAELGATVNEGIRVPARKIAVMVNQAKHLIDTLVDRAKALGMTVGATVDAKVHSKPNRDGW